MIWNMFPELAEEIRKTHLAEGLTGGGHDFEHAARVGQYALVIAPAPAIGRVAGVAGLCHNADRVLQHRFSVGRRDVPKEKMEELVGAWLELTDLGKEERALVVDAVLKHDGRNSPLDSPVLMALMDADRLVNVELDLVIRCGQFQPDLPAVDFVHFLSDPEANYRNPKSVLRDISHSLEWENGPFCLRSPKAIGMGKQRFQALRGYLNTLEAQLRESGLIPYPF